MTSGLSGRLLSIGLLLTIAAGAVVALILHPQEGSGLCLSAGRHPRAHRRGARPADLQQPEGAGAHPAGAEHRERVERRHRHAVCPALPCLCRGDRGASVRWMADHRAGRDRARRPGGRRDRCDRRLAADADDAPRLDIGRRGTARNSGAGPGRLLRLSGDRRQRLHRRFHRRHRVPRGLAQPLCRADRVHRDLRHLPVAAGLGHLRGRSGHYRASL